MTYGSYLSFRAQVPIRREFENVLQFRDPEIRLVLLLSFTESYAKLLSGF